MPGRPRSVRGTHANGIEYSLSGVYSFPVWSVGVAFLGPVIEKTLDLRLKNIVRPDCRRWNPNETISLID